MGEKKPYLAVILVQSIYGGMFLLSKAVFDVGMNNFVFFFYRQAAATLFLIPLAAYFEWKNRPRMSFIIFCKSFMLSLVGITLSFGTFGIGITYTSATLAAAITNCLPVITFFLALLLRMEVLRLRSSSGIAKLLGVLLCSGGVASLAFYKGPHFKLFCLHHLFGIHNNHEFQGHGLTGNTWIKGCFLLLLSNTFWGVWLILQARVLKIYPSKLLFTTLQCFQSSIQLFVMAIAVERNPQEWKLGWDVRLLAVAYCGIVVTGVTFYLQTWIVEKKGPVFLAMSNPLNFIFTILCSAIFLCHNIHLGSVLGAILLVGGLYSVLWGKSQEGNIDGQRSSVAEVDKEFSELKQIVPHTTKGLLLV